MKLLALSIYDSAVGCYQQPFYARSRGEAVRLFSDACQDKSSPFGKHPHDFTLMQVGEFDDQSGALNQTTHSKIISALECLPTGTDEIPFNQ